jgi:tetratricopeptide (TPR) repeat protein
VRTATEQVRSRLCAAAAALTIACFSGASHAQPPTMSVADARAELVQLSKLDFQHDSGLYLLAYNSDSHEVDTYSRVLIRGARFTRDAIELGFWGNANQAVWVRVPYRAIPQTFTTREHALGFFRGFQCDVIPLNPYSAFALSGEPENRHPHTLALERALAALRDAPPSPPAQADDPAFQAVVADYHKTLVKPEIPEEVRRYKVQAEFAVQQKRYSDAVKAYAAGLQLAPWWPEGHHNRAILLGELQQYDEAILEMKRFLLLEPTAPAARASQDRIYQWEAAPRPSTAFPLRASLLHLHGMLAHGGQATNWVSTDELPQP